MYIDELFLGQPSGSTLQGLKTQVTTLIIYKRSLEKSWKNAYDEKNHA